MDGDLEAEPSLGAPEGRNWHSQARWAQGCLDDREGDLADTVDDREADDSDDEVSGDENEPSLGIPDRMFNQEHLTARTNLSCTDAELDPSIAAPRSGKELVNGYHAGQAWDARRRLRSETTRQATDLRHKLKGGAAGILGAGNIIPFPCNVVLLRGCW